MPATCAHPRSALYRRRQPERTLLYRTVQTHLATWLALHDDGLGATAPAAIEREFRSYLECGILAHGLPHPENWRLTHNRNPLQSP